MRDSSTCAHENVIVKRLAYQTYTVFVRNGEAGVVDPGEPDWTWDVEFFCQHCNACRSTSGFTGPGVEKLPEWCQRAYKAAFPDTAAQSAATPPATSRT